MYLNKVIIIGNLTRDPELKSLPSGISVCNLGIATNRVWKDQSGQKQEQVEFHNIVVFGAQADSTSQYMKKGSSLMIEGRLQTRSWDDSETQKKMYKTEIVAEKVQFGPKGSGQSDSTASDSAPASAPAPAQAPASAPSSEKIEYPEGDINPDDIPF
ncbi:MAG: single-strand DNA-binding protein [Flavobacteriaceae bacterium]|jgi:single-strand DNA-binding protein